MATITKLALGKYRAQMLRNVVYRAQILPRKLDAQAWSLELERMRVAVRRALVNHPLGCWLLM